jgi:hypothetical protein
MQNAEVRDKSKTICLEKYGVEHALQSQEFKDKKKATCLKNHGVEYPMQNAEVRDKSKTICLEKYGVEHAMQNAEVSENCSKKSRQWKDYTFPCGTQVRYQGYENFAYDELVEQGYSYNDLVTSRRLVPEIWYMNNDKKHRYYVDIYIPSINKMIEVKSSWTLKCKKDNVDKKAKACIDANFTYEIWSYSDKNGKNKQVITDFN